MNQKDALFQDQAPKNQVSPSGRVKTSRRKGSILFAINEIIFKGLNLVLAWVKRCTSYLL